jgi:hypothetical protein
LVGWRMSRHLLRNDETRRYRFTFVVKTHMQTKLERGLSRAVDPPGFRHSDFTAYTFVKGTHSDRWSLD